MRDINYEETLFLKLPFLNINAENKKTAAAASLLSPRFLEDSQSNRQAGGTAC